MRLEPSSPHASIWISGSRRSLPTDSSAWKRSGESKLSEEEKKVREGSTRLNGSFVYALFRDWRAWEYGMGIERRFTLKTRSHFVFCHGLHSQVHTIVF